MNVWSLDGLVLFVIFVIPGFVALKAYEMFVPSVRRDNVGRVVDAIAYSCAIYAVFGVPLYLTLKADRIVENPVLIAVVFVLVFFVVPVLTALAWRWLRETKLFQKLAPHPTLKPWDFVFSKGEHYWVKVYTRSGEIYAGKFSDNSFASSPPADEQIFLEESWLLNDKSGFERPKHKTAGILIMGSDIKAIEYYVFT